MPILSLMPDPRPPLLGIIHKGGEGTRGETLKDNRPGEDLDYFRFTFKEGYEGYEPMLYEVYGTQQIKELEITLAGNSHDMIFDNWMVRWKYGAGLVRRCDSCFIREMVDKQGNRQRNLEIPCEQPHCLQTPENKGGCVPNGRLAVVPIAFSMATGLDGFFWLQTGSTNDIVRLNEVIPNAIIQYHHANIWTVPFLLSRQTREIPTKGKDGKKVRREKSLLRLIVSPEWRREYYRKLRAGEFALTDGNNHLLPEPEIESSKPDYEEAEYEEAEYEEELDYSISTPAIRFAAKYLNEDLQQMELAPDVPIQDVFDQAIRLGDTFWLDEGVNGKGIQFFMDESKTHFTIYTELTPDQLGIKQRGKFQLSEPIPLQIIREENGRLKGISQ